MQQEQAAQLGVLLQDTLAEKRALHDELGVLRAQLAASQHDHAAARQDANSSRKEREQLERAQTHAGVERAELHERLREMTEERDAQRCRVDQLERAHKASARHEERAGRLERDVRALESFATQARKTVRKASSAVMLIRAQQEELLAQLRLLEATAAMKVENARRATAEAADARRAAADAADARRACACAALFFRDRATGALGAAEAMRAQLASAELARARAAADAEHALGRERARARGAAGVQATNLALREMLDGAGALLGGQHVHEAVLACEVRAMERRASLGAEIEASLRTSRELDAAEHARASARDAERVDAATALAADAVAKRDEALAKATERGHEAELLAVELAALETGVAHQAQLVLELRTFLHATQAQLVGQLPPAGAGAAAARSRGRAAGLAAQPAARPAAISAQPFEPAQESGWLGSERSEPLAQPLAHAAPRDGAAAGGPAAGDGRRRPAACGGGRTPPDQGVDGRSDEPPDEFERAVAVSAGFRQAAHPLRAPSGAPALAGGAARDGHAPPQQATGAGMAADAARGQAAAAQISTPKPLIAPPAAQRACPVCDDELYGLRSKCSKCLREYHNHCILDDAARAKAGSRWTCPDCSKAKGTTSSSAGHEPAAKRARAHHRAQQPDF